MKKFLAIVLVLALALTVAACGSSQADSGATKPAASSGFMVGYGKVNITPEYSVPLAGYGNTSMRMSTAFQNYLFSNCVAVSDGQNTVLLFNNDLTSLGNDRVKDLRKAINKAHGVPEENIIIAATHTHSAPDLGNGAEANIGKYITELRTKLVEVAGIAIADMKPATGMYHGSSNPEGLNFIRHYTTEAGVFKGDNFNDLCNSPYTGHTHDADNQLQVIKFTREGGKDVIMVNWQTHPHRGGGSKNTNITSDLAGVMVAHMEEKLGADVAYFTGAAGNVNPSSRISQENATPDYQTQGRTLGNHAITILGGEMKELNLGEIKVVTQEYTGNVNHTEDHLLDYAYKVQEVWTKNNDFTEAVTLANSYGMNSPYHAGAIITKSGMAQTYTITISALHIGDLGLICAPYEMFDENGKYVKDNSPFPATFVLELCNGSNGYIPSEEGYRINCYEANTGRFEPGTGEILAKEYVKMLESICPN